MLSRKLSNCSGAVDMLIYNLDPMKEEFWTSPPALPLSTGVLERIFQYNMLSTLLSRTPTSMKHLLPEQKRLESRDTSVDGHCHIA